MHYSLYIVHFIVDTYVALYLRDHQGLWNYYKYCFICHSTRTCLALHCNPDIIIGILKLQFGAFSNIIYWVWRYILFPLGLWLQKLVLFVKICNFVIEYSLFEINEQIPKKIPYIALCIVAMPCTLPSQTTFPDSASKVEDRVSSLSLLPLHR